MSTSVGYATVSVIPSAKGFGSALSRQVDPQLQSAGRTSGGVFSNALKMGALAGAAVIAGGIGAIYATGIGEAMDASAGTAQLTAGIKSTGNAANVTAKDLNALASSIQGYSGQTDDSIVKSEQLLLTFTNIKNVGPNKIFDLATKASADMAAKMGGDASSNAILLGKALNDPVKGAAALARTGVQLDDSQKKAIKSMVASGNVMGAQKIILGELNKEFGGAAKAAGDSLPGMLNKAKRGFEDVSQSIVETILPLVLPALKSIAEIITTKVMPAVQGFLEDFKNGVGTAGTFRSALELIGSVLKTVGGFLVEHTGLLKVAAVAFGVITAATLAHSAVLAINSGALTAWVLQSTIVRVATQAWAAMQWILNAALSANPIGLIAIAVAALVAGIIYAYQNFDTFRNIINAVWSGIRVVVSGVVGFFQNVVAPAISFVFKAISAYVRAVLLVYVTAWNAIWFVVEKVVNWFTGTLVPTLAAVWSGIGRGIDAVKQVFVNAWNAIWSFFSGLALKFIQIGIDIVEGIKQGITNAWAAFTGWISEKFTGFIDGVKSILHINSPSKVFTEIGGSVVEGFTLGVSGLDKAHADVKSKFQSLVAASEQSINKLASDTKAGLDRAIQSWFDYRDSVTKAITGNVNFGDAWTNTVDQQKAITDAQQALDSARAAGGSDPSETDAQAIADAQTKLAAAQAAAKDFMTNIGTQVDQSQLFGNLLNQVQSAVTAQFDEESLVWPHLRDQLVAAGPSAGTPWAQAIVDNGFTPAMTAKLMGFYPWADKVGIDQAKKNFDQGISTAKDLMKGVTSKIKAEEKNIIKLGGDIGDGLVIGFKDKTSAFGEAVDGYIKEAFKKFEVKSPSRVFMRLGAFAGEGYNIGWDGAIMDPASMLPAAPISSAGSLDFASTSQRQAAISAVVDSKSNEAELLAAVERLSEEFRRQTDVQVNLKRQGAI